MDTENTSAATSELGGSDEDFANAFAEFQTPASVTDADSTPGGKNGIDSGATAPVVAPENSVPDTKIDNAATVDVVVPGDKGDDSPGIVPNDQAKVDRITELEALLAAAHAPAPAPSAAPIVEAPAVPVYSTDEQALIDKYRTDWPDIHAGEALIRRAEYRDIVSYVFDQVRAQLEPLSAFYQSQHGRTQYSDIVALVPDYDAVRDKTLAWVDTQPEYLKRAYQEVTNSGSAEEVADLINRFKKETGVAIVVAKEVVSAPAVTKALPAAAAVAATALRVVKSSRSEVPQTVDPNDFDGAFAEFSKTK